MRTPLMERFENVFIDLFFRQRPPIAVHPAIVHIDMAEDSLQSIGRWPWPRHTHAVIARILKEWGAKAIVFDVIFSEPSTTFDDGALTQAIKEAGNVYMPVMIESVDGRQEWVHLLPEFRREVKGIGHVNIFPDHDGTLRHVQPFLKSNGEIYPYIGLKVAYDYLGKPMPTPEKIGIPVDQEGRILINWVGSWKTSFRHYSFLDVVMSYSAIQKGQKPVISPEAIRGKICVIGLTALGLTDIKASPVEGAYPAVGIQTNIMNSVLTNNFARTVSPKWNRIALIVIGLLVALFFIFSRQVIALFFCLSLGLIWVLFAFWIFVKYEVWIFVMNPLLLILSLFVFSAVFSIRVGRREQARLFTLATRDGLTGLYVIRHFRTLLNEAVVEAHKKQQPLSLILLDLDFFKSINDKHGHVAGDMALKYVAKNLKELSNVTMERKEANVAGRYGGEEFIIMFRKCHLNDAAFNYGEKIRSYFEKNPFEYEGVKIPITLSLGVASLWPDETVPDLMVHRADEALYRAKTDGRNRTCVEIDASKKPGGKEVEHG